MNRDPHFAGFSSILGLVRGSPDLLRGRVSKKDWWRRHDGPAFDDGWRQAQSIDAESLFLAPGRLLDSLRSCHQPSPERY